MTTIYGWVGRSSGDVVRKDDRYLQLILRRKKQNACAWMPSDWPPRCVKVTVEFVEPKPVKRKPAMVRCSGADEKWCWGCMHKSLHFRNKECNDGIPCSSDGLHRVHCSAKYAKKGSK